MNRFISSMPQVSKYPLDKALEKRIFQQFWFSISSLEDADQVSSFFSDLLTETEEKMLAKRFTVAVLILRGKRPVDIKSTLHVTYSTIGSVASWVKNAKPQTQRLLLKIIKGNNWQKILDRIEELIDDLPPAYGTDWSKAGKEKWKRKVERSARRPLL